MIKILSCFKIPGGYQGVIKIILPVCPEHATRFLNMIYGSVLESFGYIYKQHMSIYVVWCL